MVFEEGEFKPLAWTYADYKEDRHREFFRDVREVYYEQLRSQKGAAGKESVTYRDAGVDIEEGERAIVRIKKMVKETFGDNVLSELGKFGGFYSLQDTGFDEPVLVSSVDGVGTKLKVAFAAGTHNTVGQDLVNHCVNDVLCCGARPLFFLDYLAFGKLVGDVFEEIISGFAKACREVGAALIGGETAEMPGIYSEGEYDISGTIVGLAEKRKILDGSKIKKGDVIFGLPSTGLHTNGYSLARKIVFDVAGYTVDTRLPELENSVGEELLKIHRCYFNEIYPLIEGENVNGLAHITGGGLTGNISRLLSGGLEADIKWDSWEWLPIFKILQKIGNVPDEEMRHVFNLGIGLAIITDEQNADMINSKFKEMDQEIFHIGDIK
ncbi:MAG: phosphoribosylformylglycinamidine cyclo-ligase [bacterium]|nr:phosphoribosylformylglycinamidine cyclo-ligase [bacterium]